MGEFRMEDLVSDIKMKKLSTDEIKILDAIEYWLSFEELKRIFREYYYEKGHKKYEDWFADKDSSGSFYETLYKIVEPRKEWFPDQIKALSVASVGGESGRKLFANIAQWFQDEKLIREDMTIKNAKLFKYLDTYCWSGYRFEHAIFSRYNTIEDLNKLSEKAAKYLQSNLNSYEYGALKKQIDSGKAPKNIKQNLESAHTKIKKNLARGLYENIIAKA